MAPERWLFLFAVAVHIALLAWPHAKEIELPPPPLTVKLIEALKPPPEPQPVALPPPPPPPPQAKPTPNRPRPVLAMTPEQRRPSPQPRWSPRRSRRPEPAPRPPVAAAPWSPPRHRSSRRYNAAYLNNPEPKYPRCRAVWARRARCCCGSRHRRRSGRGGRTGKSSGFERLDEAAKQAVARWRFVPAKRGDEAIEASVIVPIVFRLDN
jgi:protein TonB